MNDGDFIIISSDEEIEVNSISKRTEPLGNVENTEQTHSVTRETGSLNNHTSIYKSDRKEIAHCSQIPIAGDENSNSSKNTKYYESNKAQDVKINNKTLKDSKKCVQNDMIETKTDNNFDNMINENQIQTSSAFNEFLQLVLSIEVKEDDKQKLKKKILKYHNLADPEYLKSDEFNNILENGIARLTKKPLLLYPIIKELLDCLLSKRVLLKRRKTQKSKSPDAEEGSSGEIAEKDVGVPDLIYFDADSESYKAVKKLTKALKKLEIKIKELEVAEVDLSDEEDSTYFRMQRYRERYCQIYKKLCTYTSQSASAKRMCTRKITFNGSNNLQLDRAIESWLNKTMQFPDYASVLKLIIESNENLHLGYTKEQLKKMAVDIFTKIGNSLQLRRKYDLWESFNSFLDNEIDPSIYDAELRERLDLNFEIAYRKEKKILKYFADLQTKNSLEPAEVPDEEVSCSPVESGDDDEKEIEEVENILNSRIAVEVEDNEEEDEETNVEENEQENANLSSASEDVRNANSVKSDVSSKSKHVPESTTLENGTNEGSVSKDIPNPSVATSTKDQNCKDVENCENRASGTKRLPETEITQCVKKQKLSEAEVLDSDSDCEIVLVLSDDETNFKPNKKDVFKKRKVHQVNYSFINNSFNHNVLLMLHDPLLKRKNSYSYFKSRKDKGKIHPLSDMTNMKRITNKYTRTTRIIGKETVQESVRLYRRERTRLRYSKFMYLDKMSHHCSLRNESKSENLQRENESNQTSEKNSADGNSDINPITSSNNSGSGGGDDEDRRDKKPSLENEEIFENEEVEDDEEEEEDDEEAFQIYRNDATSRERSDLVNESNGNENSNISTDGLLLTRQQLVCVTIDVPHPISITPDLERDIPGKPMTTRENGGLPGTSGSASMNNSCKVKPPWECSRQRVSTLPDLAEVERVYSQRRKTASTKTIKSDEEIVNDFLQHSPSSISITIPRNLLIKKPSPSILEALKTLNRLKSITTTVVKASDKKEDDVTVIGESFNISRSNGSSVKCNEIQKGSFVLPKIVTVQGNVSGFESMKTENSGNISPDKALAGPRRRRTRSSQPLQSDNPDSKRDITLRMNSRTRQRSSKRMKRQPSKNNPAGQQSTKKVEYVVLD